MDIGERSAKPVNHLLRTFASLLLARKRVEFNEINRHKIISSLKLTLVYKAKMRAVVRTYAAKGVSKTVKSDNKRITALNSMSIDLHKSLILR
jgi:hypothetical protein